MGGAVRPLCHSKVRVIFASALVPLCMSDSLPLCSQLAASPAFSEKLCSVGSAGLQEREMLDGVSDAGCKDDFRVT